MVEELPAGQLALNQGLHCAGKVLESGGAPGLLEQPHVEDFGGCELLLSFMDLVGRNTGLIVQTDIIVREATQVAQ